MQTFAERLTELREQAGLTQQQLADASGVNLWSIRGYEQGRREPNWIGVIQLARGLGVSAETFADCISKDDAGPRRGRRGRLPAAAVPKAAGKSPPSRKPRGRPRKEK